jgi:tetratricopeptide (TPR) repeat protein
MSENKSVATDLNARSQLKSLELQAIQAALTTDWQKAIDLNQQILKLDKSNSETHNRLGRAYSESGQIERARTSYQAVLRLDPYNSIALKNLERLRAINSSKAKTTNATSLSPDLFMEEPGKTKVLEATNLAQPEILAQLHSADQVKLEPDSQGVAFKNSAGHLLGTYQGILSAKLVNLLKSGNVYDAYVKSVKPSELKIFVREIKRAAKYSGVPSFPLINNGFKPYVHESAIETATKHFELEISDTTATEAAVAKKIASVESLAEQEIEPDQSSNSNEE